MSELDVIVIHIRAEQAAEYERLFAERELPRWREYKERGAFISARIFRAAFGTDRRDDIAKYVIAVEVPGHAEHSQHDADPGFQGGSTGSPDLEPPGTAQSGPGGQALGLVTERDESMQWLSVMAPPERRFRAASGSPVLAGG